jgi:hypothetical protein
VSEFLSALAYLALVIGFLVGLWTGDAWVVATTVAVLGLSLLFKIYAVLIEIRTALWKQEREKVRL